MKTIYYSVLLAVSLNGAVVAMVYSIAFLFIICLSTAIVCGGCVLVSLKIID